MNNNKLKLSELWALIRQKEKANGLNHLSLVERDILENIAFIMQGNKKISLETILKHNNHPRATFFRSLKKLRDTRYIKIKKENEDKRKSIVNLCKNIE